jgi:TRAP-type C4-dicarboxylate transport system permease small subunit
MATEMIIVIVVVVIVFIIYGWKYIHKTKFQGSKVHSDSD